MWFIDFSHEGWHRYRLTMNESEVEEHRIESGEEFLLITAKVSLCLWGSANVELSNLRSVSCKCCWFFQFPNVVDERKGGWGTQIREKGRVFANYHKGWRGVIGVEGRLISVSFLMCILGKEFHEWMWVNVNMWMNITVNLGRLVKGREIQESVAENEYLHTSYLSQEPRVYPCKFFLAGVNFLQI